LSAVPGADLAMIGTALAILTLSILNDRLRARHRLPAGGG